MKLPLAPAFVRAVFGVLERASPAVGAWLAERLWFTVPRSRARGGQPGGHRLQVRLHGARIVGQWWGDGPVVCLMHGWGGRHTDLGALAGPLVRAGYRVVAFDAPSHGESEPGRLGRRKSTIVEFAELLEAVGAAEGPLHAIVAHSLGCLAAAVAVQNGLSAQRLVFIAPMGNVADYAREFVRRAGVGERTRTRFTGRIERQVSAPLAFFDVASIAARLPGPPLLLIHDTDDPQTRYADSEKIAASWPGARLVTTTGLGHRRILRSDVVIAEAVPFIDDAQGWSGAPAPLLPRCAPRLAGR
jgi:pimeloyl-ACP methyl ester carboxylesterase